MFINMTKKFKLDSKISFITTYAANSAKMQVMLTSAEENIILDIYEDPGGIAVLDSDYTAVYIDEILCCLKFGED